MLHVDMLKYSAQRVLKTLVKLPPEALNQLRISAIARSTGLTVITVRRQIRCLDKQGYINRRRPNSGVAWSFGIEAKSFEELKDE